MQGINDQQYTKFTPHERILLTMSALARGDAAEADRLWDTCPKYLYSCHDLEFALRIQGISALSGIFFEECVRIYNLIQRIDAFRDGLIDDIEFFKQGDVNKGLSELIEHNQTQLKTATDQKEKVTARLKALFAAFSEFFSEVGLNSEHILATLKIEECCYRINFLLSSKIEMDEEYKKEIKAKFLELWQS